MSFNPRAAPRNEVETLLQQLQSQAQNTSRELSEIIHQVRSSNLNDVRDLEYSLEKVVRSLQDERDTLSALLSHPKVQGGFNPGHPAAKNFLEAIERGVGFGLGEELPFRILR